MSILMKRKFVVEQYENKKTRSDILRMGKHLNLNAMFMKRTLDRYEDTKGINDRSRSGRPRSQRTPKLVKAVREKIRRNPKRSMRKLAKEYQTSPMTMHRLCRNDLGMYPFKLKKCQLLSEATRKKRLDRSKILLKRSRDGTLSNIIFSNEKLFTVEAAFNHQNDRILAQSAEAIPTNARKIRRTQKPASLMVWAAVSSLGKSPLIFVPSGVKINKDHYISHILESGLLPWTEKQYPNGDWTFQQDGATSHTANVTQQWCKKHCPRFVSKEEWPPSSPDLNVLDYFVWSILEKKACATPAPSISVLKQKLIKAWSEIDQSILRAAIKDFPRRLQAVIKVKGDHFK